MHSVMVNKMAYWVIYDIATNATRSRVANICKNYGLERIQKSAFLGQISKNRAQNLAAELERMKLSCNDCIFLLAACEDCIRNKIIFGNADMSVFEQRTHIIFGNDNELANRI